MLRTERCDGIADPLEDSKMRLALLLAMLAGCQAKPVVYELMEVRHESHSTKSPVSQVARNRGVNCRQQAAKRSFEIRQVYLRGCKEHAGN
jgi:hypothetical protein